MEPISLVTVNNAPERAKRLIGRMIEALRDRYTIVHAGNCESPAEVGPKIQEIQPDVLFCASMWTKDEADEAFRIARTIKPDIKTYAIPHGLQVNKGPDAVVDFLVQNTPQLFESTGKGQIYSQR